MADAGIVLQLKCRNCGTTYRFDTPYTTFSAPPADYDKYAADPNFANRAPKCPHCESWAAEILGQTGG